jgi:uncharacterized membrane protein
VDRSHRLRIAGLAFVFLWFFVGGIAHFVATATEMRIVPPFIPWPRATVLTTGVFELLGALGVLGAWSRPAAGAGLLLLTLAVTPANIYMLQLVVRLPLQLLLLWLIAWSTEVTSLFERARLRARAHKATH